MAIALAAIAKLASFTLNTYNMLMSSIATKLYPFNISSSA
jgi:hypothetical protein